MIPKYLYNRDFKEAFKDEWGQEWVYCTVCELPHKKDGVIKHIIAKCDLAGSLEHCAWLEVNKTDNPEYKQ